MTLPRYALPEDDDDDSTAPAEFLLKLPPSYARKLAALAPPTPGEWMLPVVMPSPAKAKPRSPSRVAAAIAGVAVAVAIIAGVGGALAQSSEGPVGISKHAPKKLELATRLPTWQTGVAHAHVAPADSHARHSSKKRGKR